MNAMTEIVTDKPTDTQAVIQATMAFVIDKIASAGNLYQHTATCMRQGPRPLTSLASDEDLKQRAMIKLGEDLDAVDPASILAWARREKRL